MNYSLLENYQWVGTFWIAGKENEKFSGKLYWNKVSGIKLELITSGDLFDNQRENLKYSY